MMARLFLMSIFFVLTTLFVTGCDANNAPSDPGDSASAPERVAAEENPELAAQAAQESAKQMLALAKDNAWEGLIDGYYGEADKLTDSVQKQALVKRFEDGWGEKLIPVLEQAAEIKPVIQDGKALFQIDGETIYELHLGDDGRWGFHL